jgi:large subunit ribosomal protein L25
MAEPKSLVAHSRARVGKGAARSERRADRVPAVIYGGGEAPLAIALDRKQASQLIFAGHFLTTIFDIDVGGKKLRAIPRDYQLDKVSDVPLHVDFLRIGAGQRIRVAIPVHFAGQGVSPGLRRGGTLNIVRHSVEFYVPAEAVPDSITVDLSTLDINDAAKISSVKLPQGVTPVIRDRDFTIATVAVPAGFKEETAAAAAAAAAATAAPTAAAGAAAAPAAAGAKAPAAAAGAKAPAAAAPKAPAGKK